MTFFAHMKRQEVVVLLAHAPTREFRTRHHDFGVKNVSIILGIFRNVYSALYSVPSVAVRNNTCTKNSEIRITFILKISLRFSPSNTDSLQIHNCKNPFSTTFDTSQSINAKRPELKKKKKKKLGLYSHRFLAS